jgi:hypothetical protein
VQRPTWQSLYDHPRRPGDRVLRDQENIFYGVINSFYTSEKLFAIMAGRAGKPPPVLTDGHSGSADARNAVYAGIRLTLTLR